MKTITVPSRTESIKKVSSEILKCLSPYRVGEEKLADVKLCTEEAVRNAVVHGNRSDERLNVKVNYWVSNDALHIEVEDEGEGFKPERLPDPTKEPHILRGSGRGVYLIMRLMDSVEFNEKGNKITMVKNLKEKSHGGKDRC